MTRARYGSRRGRGTGYLSGGSADADLRALHPRLSMDNDARSRSAEPHDRRKPGLFSAGNPELQTNAMDSRVAAPDFLKNVHIGEQIAAGKLPQIAGLQGSLPADKLPSGVIVGKIGRPDISRGAVGNDEIGAVGFDKIIPSTIPNYAGKGYVDDRERETRAWAKRTFAPRGKK